MKTRHLEILPEDQSWLFPYFCQNLDKNNRKTEKMDSLISQEFSVVKNLSVLVTQNGIYSVSKFHQNSE